MSSEKHFEMKATITLVSVCGFILYFGFETLWGYVRVGAKKSILDKPYLLWGKDIVLQFLHQLRSSWGPGLREHLSLLWV